MPPGVPGPVRRRAGLSGVFTQGPEVRKLQKLREFWRASVASISILLGMVVHRFVETIPLEIQFVVGLLAVGLIIHLSEIVLTALIDSAPSLRRAILGDRFVEGIWVEVVHDQPEGERAKVKYGALLSITFSDGELAIAGDVYDAEGGTPLGAFSSRRVVFEDEFSYVYDQIVRTQISMRQVGFGLLFFGKGTGRPITFNGYFVDPNFPRPLGVYGKRLDDKLVATLKADDKAKRVQVMNFVKEYMETVTPAARPGPPDQA